MQPGRLTLDNPIFADTLRRSSGRSVTYAPRRLQRATIEDIAAVRSRPLVERSNVPKSTPQQCMDVRGDSSPATVPQRTKLEMQGAVRPAPAVVQDDATAQTTSNQKKRSLRSVRRPQLVLYGMAAGLFLFGCYLGYDGWRANHRVAAQVQQLQKTAEAPASGTGAGAPAVVPSTEKPTDTAVREYVVAPNLPRYLDIPKLGVHTRVLSMGVDKNNELQAPTNVHNAGWYNASAQPGQSGGMLIDGHSGIGNYHGVFHGIDTLVAGDVLTVTRGDGAKFDYYVAGVETVDANAVNMASMLVSADTAKPGLNLITCAGDQIPGTYQLSQRTMVRAVMK